MKYAKMSYRWIYRSWTCKSCGFVKAIKLINMMYHVEDKCPRCNHSILGR